MTILSKKRNIVFSMLAFVLCFAVLIGCFPFNVGHTSADDAGSTVAEGNWTDFTTDIADDGKGASDAPIQIGSAEELAYFSITYTGNEYADVYFELTADIDLSAHFWIQMEYFYGNLNGNNHTITGMTLREHYLGINCYIGFIAEFYGHTIENINFKNVDIQITVSVYGCIYMGALAGRAASDFSMQNCYVEGGKFSADADTVEVGGLIARIETEAAEIQDCYVKNIEINASANWGYIAGLVASAQGGSNQLEMQDCFVEDCEINLSDFTGAYVGGMFGYFAQNSSIENCFVEDCLINLSSQKEVYECCAGLFTASNNWTTTVDGCFVNNCEIITDFSSDRAYLGGITGWNRDTLTIQNSYVSECKISADLESANSYIKVGGIVGFNDYELTVRGCYVKDCEISAGSHAGGIVGFDEMAQLVVEKCYVAGNALSAETETYAIAPVYDELTCMVDVIDLDVIDLDREFFKVDERYNDGLPYLKWQTFGGSDDPVEPKNPYDYVTYILIGVAVLLIAVYVYINYFKADKRKK